MTQRIVRSTWTLFAEVKQRENGEVPLILMQAFWSDLDDLLPISPRIFHSSSCGGSIHQDARLGLPVLCLSSPRSPARSAGRRGRPSDPAQELGVYRALHQLGLLDKIDSIGFLRLPSTLGVRRGGRREGSGQLSNPRMSGVATSANLSQLPLGACCWKPLARVWIKLLLYTQNRMSSSNMRP